MGREEAKARRAEVRSRTDALKALAKSEMGAVERMGKSGALSALAGALAPDECVARLFGAQINGKHAILALTDRRVLATYGMLGRSDSIDYRSIGQVNTGLSKIEIQGAGVHLVAKAMSRKDDLVRELQARRQQEAAPVQAVAAVSAADDPVARLRELAELHQAGVLTDEEFVTKKAELLTRM